MFWTFKLSFEGGISAFFGLETVWATFQNIGCFFNLLVTLPVIIKLGCWVYFIIIYLFIYRDLQIHAE
jgi:hypothetical protein